MASFSSSSILARTVLAVGLFALTSGVANAHDPIFGLGPHVLFKHGVEVAPGIHVDEQGSEQEVEIALELKYGITGDWSVGIEIPYARHSEDGQTSSGRGDASVLSKWRFWRRDSPGVQKSSALLVNIKTDSGRDGRANQIGTGTTDVIAGLSYGYESRRWYRWASLRVRRNGENDMGLRRGDAFRLDLVGGLRTRLTGYREPDTVWLLELNGEYGERAERRGVELRDTGGSQWFLSPGIFWTKRNFAVKAGVQIPISDNLNGTQEATDYRATLVFEWHL